MTDPRATPDLVGHDDAARTLQDAARSGRLHHAWLICGAPGIGKATLAWRFARWLLAGMPASEPPLWVDPASPVFRRIAADTHADCFTLEPNIGDKGGVKRVLRVDDARDAVRFLTQTAAEGGWRVVVMDEAERADQALVQNTLLKTLEEPPPKTVLLLACSAPQKLLPTIRSRCRRLDLNPLTEAEMETLLARLLPGAAAGERARLAALSAGSPGRAMALMEAGGLALQDAVEASLAALLKGEARDHALADRLAMDRTGGAFGIFFALLRGAIAAALRDAARGQPAPGWMGRHPLAVWAGLWDRLGTLADDTERLNLDRKQAVLTGLSWLARP